ncbi:MAG: hypothetical protein KF716_03105 [Anaerolineae bacterium]|nr:hypothetical protein [Anaerolineae bacterium]
MQPPIDANESPPTPAEAELSPLPDSPTGTSKIALPPWLANLPISTYLANTWIAGAAGGIVLALVFGVVALLLPAHINLPIVGDTLLHTMLLGLAIPMSVLAVTIAERRFSGTSSFLKVSLSALATFIVICLLVQWIAGPRLPLGYNQQPTNIAAAMIIAGAIPVFVFALLASRNNWGWFGVLATIAVGFTYIPLLILAAIVVIIMRSGFFNRPPPVSMTADEMREAMRRNGRT